jgi:aminomethyltransferase
MTDPGGREPEAVRSILHDAQVAQGATFRDDDGWLWTTGFGDPAAGYTAVTEGAAAWDVYPLVKWDVTGPQAAAAVQKVCTADVLGQQPGQVRYGAFTDDDGLMIDDGTVFKHADDHLWVFTNTSGVAAHWSEQTAGMDVAFHHRLPEMPLVSVQGPGSRELLASLTSADVHGLRYFRFLPERVDVGGVPSWLMRTGFSGELGFELVPVPDGAVQLWEALAKAGAVPIGLDTVEPVRIEAGLIIYSTDYTPGEHTPYDVCLDRFVALDSGADFVGRTRLSEVAAAPPNRLKTLQLHGDDLPDVGATVVDPGSGAQVGAVSSRVSTPRFGCIGLAMLQTASAVDGRVLRVSDGTRSMDATVAPLSIKDPAKTMPRS